MTDGIILIDKPAHMTSFGVVARVRRVLTQQNGRKTKVGHTGTLDPFATGLMILTVGTECKNALSYTKLDKEYQAVIKLGEKSTTGDPEGELTTISDYQPTRAEIVDVMEKFTGEVEQTPPAFSAIKIDGQRAYKLARQGKSVDMPKRRVTIYNLQLLQYDYPHVTISAKVSSGTYIRTLAEDIGDLLNTGAYCAELRRISIDRWRVEEAKNLEEFMTAGK